MIPKIIHYCWFGKADMPEDYKSYIKGWEELHPDWEIKRWDETNSPITIPYIRNAIANGNWANISNFIRLYALNKTGGIYLDTDMKLLKPLNPLLSHNCFIGFESGSEEDPVFWVNNAITGAIANHPFIDDCENTILEQFDGTENANLSSPHLATNVLKSKYGLTKYGRQKLGDIMLFEKEVFYPIAYDKAYLLKEQVEFPENTIAVHMWGRTWFSHAAMLNIIDSLQEALHALRSAIAHKDELISAHENTIRQAKDQAILDADLLRLSNEKLNYCMDEQRSLAENSRIELEQVNGNLRLSNEKLHSLQIEHKDLNKELKNVVAENQHQVSILNHRILSITEELADARQELERLNQKNNQSLIDIELLTYKNKIQEDSITLLKQTYEEKGLLAIAKIKLFSKKKKFT